MIGFSFSFSLANVVVDKKTGLMWQDNYEAKSVKKHGVELSSTVKILL